ncbi:hypothetical protein PMAYCL1PPCAC_17933, partial [Pristionchus mayeri]
GIIRSLEKDDVDLFVPKFRIETTVDGKAALQNLGLSRIFDRSADFSDMSPSLDLFISSISHKCLIAVDEEGTTAAAKTKFAFQTLCAHDMDDEPP